jgi:pimeloyl-ACP methyl ester carboxylesterase
LDFFTGTDQAAFGPGAKPEVVELWKSMLIHSYKGEEGRLRLREVTVATLTRDSLHLRLPNITQPFLWIQGDHDGLFSVENARFELALTNSVAPSVEIIEGGYHAPNWSHPDQVDKLVLDFLGSMLQSSLLVRYATLPRNLHLMLLANNPRLCMKC